MTGHALAECHQARPVEKLEDKIEALPGILARLDGITRSLEEVATLMKDSATIQANLRNLEKSDREQWQKINTLTSAPGRWMHTVTASLVSGALVGILLVLVQ